jgi:hypothetical protein
MDDVESAGQAVIGVDQPILVDIDVVDLNGVRSILRQLCDSRGFSPVIEVDGGQSCEGARTRPDPTNFCGGNFGRSVRERLSLGFSLAEHSAR